MLCNVFKCIMYVIYLMLSGSGIEQMDRADCMCVCVCVFVVWDGEKENRDIDRGGECRVGRALVSLASRPPPRVCKA